MKIDIFIKKILLIVFIGMNTMISGCKIKNEKYDLFKIIFWEKKSNSDIVDMQSLSYKELAKNYTSSFILTDKDILKYYWEEQFLLVNSDFFNEFIPTNSGCFSVIFDNKVIYTGINRTFITSKIQLYDESSYPVIQLIQENIFCLKPKYYEINYTFKNFSDDEKKHIINKDIYNYFKKKNKIVHGAFYQKNE